MFWIISHVLNQQQFVVETGVIVIALGEERLTLLEILGIENSTFDIGERVYIGKEGRTKVQSVLGKMDYGKTSDSAKNEIPNVVESNYN